MNTFYKVSNYLNSPEVLSLVFDNRFMLILFVILLTKLKNSTYRSMYMSAIINIPGTILHEAMHYVVGGLLNAQPVNFSVWPKKDNMGNYVMGSVGFKNITFYNALPATMAPLLLLIMGFYINRYLLPLIEPSFVSYILYILLQTIIIENAIPSRVDFAVAFRHKLGLLMYIILFALGFGLI